METRPSAQASLFYEDLIRSYLEAPLYIERPWLEHLVLDALEEPDCRFVLLTAEPGAGKSTFAAQLAAAHPAWPRYFIRRDQRQPLANAGARSFLMRVGLQLAETYPHLLEQEDIVLDVEQEVSEMGQAGQVLGASIGTLVASPFYRQVVVKVRQNVERVRGSLQGIRIDTVIADPTLLSLNDLQNMALLDPARRLQADSAGVLVILVDALDELRYHDAEDNVLHWLTGCPVGELPENVRFVLTSRPPDRALTLFQETQKPNVKPLSLEWGEGTGAAGEVRDHLQADARAYADQLVALAPLAPYWPRAGVEAAAFAAEAVAKAQGNLGYLDAIARALRQAAEQDDERTIQSLLDLQELPGEQKDLYTFFLNQVQERVRDSAVRVRDPATGRAVYVGVWESVYLPMLGVLSVAFAPLTLQQIHDLGQIHVSLAVTSSLLDRLRNFLDQVGDAYRLYHASFAEFLIDPATVETAPELYCDPLEWHACVAGSYRGRYAEGEDWHHCDPYGLRHLPLHLAGAQEDDTLRQLLLNYPWLQAKLDATEPTALVSDYSLVQDDEILDLVESALRLSAHILAQDKSQLAGQLVGRLLVHPLPEIQGLLERATGWRDAPWLRPLNPALLPAGSPIQRTLATHAYPVRAVAVSQDGCLAVSAADDKTLLVWDLQTGLDVRSLTGHSAKVLAVAITTDGRRALSGARDRTVRVWDLGTGAEIRCLAGHQEPVSAVVVTPDGRMVVSGSYDATLKVWDLEQGVERQTLHGHAFGVNGLALVDDGRVVSASYDRTLKLWDLQSGQELRTYHGHQGPVTAVAVVPGERFILSASSDGTCRLWDLESGREVRCLRGHRDEVTGVAVTPGGLGVSASWDHTLRVWDLESGAEVGVLRGHTFRVLGVAVTPDGQVAVSASEDTTLKVWDLSDPARAPGYPKHEGAVYGGVAVTRDGRLAITAADDYTLKVWDLWTGAELHTLRGDHGPVRSVALLPEGDHIVSYAVDGTIMTWDPWSGQKLGETYAHATRVRGEAVTPHCIVQNIQPAGDAGPRRLVVIDWERAIGMQTRDRSERTFIDWDPAMDLQATSTRIALPSFRGTRVLEVETGRLCDAHSRHFTTLVVSPDGTRAVTTAEDRTVTLWDVATGAELSVLRGHSRDVWGVALSADGRRAVSISDDRTLVLWDLVEETVIARFSADGALLSCAISPDGTAAVAGDEGGSVYLLRVEGM